jgi:hypothetical protein
MTLEIIDQTTTKTTGIIDGTYRFIISVNPDARWMSSNFRVFLWEENASGETIWQDGYYTLNFDAGISQAKLSVYYRDLFKLTG